jgi:4-aminobutyrate aminotransferase
MTFEPHKKELPLSEGDVNLSPRRQEWLQNEIDAETASWLEEDARYFLHQSVSTPCLDVLERCEGIYLEDLQGRRLMDFHGNSVHQVGFGNRRVIEALKAQLDTLPFCTRRYTNKTAIELAKKLTELAPGRLNKVLFAPGGAEAMGMALKLARLATGQFKTLSLWDSFHGASLDTISIGGEALFRQGIGPLLPGTEHAPPPNPYRCLFGCGGSCQLRCADYIDYVLEKEGDIGAVIAEPVRSTIAGLPPEGYWERVRASCDRHGALLIFDEIPTCLGRTGRMFASESVGVTPDMLVIGKGLGGGVIPIAALLAREDLDIAGDRALGHYTHEKSPLGAAAALATIACIEEEDLLAHARTLGEHAVARLEAMQPRHRLIGDVRGMGLLIVAELVRDRLTREPAADEADALMYAALRRGLSFKVTSGNVLTLTPPLTITHEEMDRALDILDACLTEIEAR